MHASYCYHDSYQETVLVNDDMAFDAFHLYIAVNAIKGTVVTPADTLAVHNTNACLGILTVLDTNFFT